MGGGLKQTGLENEGVTLYVLSEICPYIFLYTQVFYDFLTCSIYQEYPHKSSKLRTSIAIYVQLCKLYYMGNKLIKCWLRIVCVV